MNQIVRKAAHSQKRLRKSVMQQAEKEFSSLKNNNTTLLIFRVDKSSLPNL